jgi:hypothetical protein
LFSGGFPAGQDAAEASNQYRHSIPIDTRLSTFANMTPEQVLLISFMGSLPPRSQ